MVQKWKILAALISLPVAAYSMSSLFIFHKIDHASLAIKPFEMRQIDLATFTQSSDQTEDPVVLKALNKNQGLFLVVSRTTQGWLQTILTGSDGNQWRYFGSDLTILDFFKNKEK